MSELHEKAIPGSVHLVTPAASESMGQAPPGHKGSLGARAVTSIDNAQGFPEGEAGDVAPGCEPIPPFFLPQLPGTFAPSEQQKDDVAVFAQQLSRGASPVVALERLMQELDELLVERRGPVLGDCDFELDVPGLGRLEGRVSVRRGQADLELRALRPASAAVLRARAGDLQQLVDRQSDGEVNLLIL